MRPSASFIRSPGVASAPDLASEVRRGLTAPQKQLSPRWLYDALGSSLFEAICLLPWYTITQAEMRLLDRVAHEIALRLPHVHEFVELGPGSGEKLARLVTPFLRRPAPVKVHLVDVSADALAQATRRLSSLPRVDVRAHLETFESGLEAIAEESSGVRRLVALLGSNIGNFDPEPARAFLDAIAAALSPGDAFLLGADLVKPGRSLLDAYDDPLGVTAAFNLNLLARLNREIGARFDLRSFRHEARWVAEAGRVEMHLVSRTRQSVPIPGAGIEAGFAANESIWTESSYKYEPDQLRVMGERAGFSTAAQWIDEPARFALTLYTRTA
jgi:L-histidine N-alpha-methyltransferase